MAEEISWQTTEPLAEHNNNNNKEKYKAMHVGKPELLNVTGIFCRLINVA